MTPPVTVLNAVATRGHGWQRILSPRDHADVRLKDDFLSVQEARRYFHAMDKVPWQQRSVHVGGRMVPQPRLVCLLGDKAYAYSGLALDPLPWGRVPVVAEIREKVEDVCARRFNSALMNYYRDGNDSISWHADDEPALGEHPIIASLSLGATRTFEMRRRNQRGVLNLPLQTGSLLVMAGKTQEHWLHRIDKEPGAGPRINLTFRTIK